jgi:DNA-binding MarR family transcriptional regulator
MAALPLPPGVPPSRRARLASRLNSAAIHMLRRVAIDDGADGVSAARLSALSVLVFAGPQTLGSLARVERVSLPTMSRLVEALAAAGLVVRTPRPDDRRTVRVAVTPSGRGLVERARARRIRRLEDLLQAHGSADVRLLEEAVSLLERLEAEPSAAAPNRPSHSRRGKRGRL